MGIMDWEERNVDLGCLLRERMLRVGIECVWKHRDGNCGGRKRKVGRGRQSKDGREEFKLGKSGECV